MSVRRGQETDVQRLLSLLDQYRDFVEQVFHEREVYVGTHEQAHIDMLDALRRERLIRVEEDSHGGATVRLGSQVRGLLNITTRHRRLQRIGVNVRDTLQQVEHLVDTWRIYHERGRMEDADQTVEEIDELLIGVEQDYDEQLESLEERISTNYGFEDEPAKRVHDFKLYMERLEEMRRGAEEFLHELEGEDFEGVAFIAQIAGRLRGRFRRHGQRITRLSSDLEYYIARIRDRQRQTRKNLRFLQWLKRQPAQVEVASARAAANAEGLSILRRARALPLQAEPDYGNYGLAQKWATIYADVEKRKRARDRGRRNVERRSSGKRWNSQAQERDVADQAVAEQQNRWDPDAWIHGCMREAVWQGYNDPQQPYYSVSEYWHQCAVVGDETPTLRAWLNEVLVMALTDKPVDGVPFFERFEVRYDPPIPTQRVRHPVVVDDIEVRVRPEALRQHQRKAG